MVFAQQDKGPLIDVTLSPLLEDHGIPLAVMGILVVFIALALVVSFITLLPRLLGQVNSQPTEQPVVPQILAEDEVSEETLIVIAAAVAEMIRVPHRIVRIRGLTPEDLGWSLEGRMQHHQSHRPRR